MKYLLLIAFVACGYGQYPNTRYNGNDYTPQFDSSSFYAKKEAYWQKKYEKELKRLNHTGHKNDISESLLMFQDSAIRYKLLLSNYKK